MGLVCPTCGTHQPIVQQLTTHQGKTNLFARDVIGQRLGCGHDIYGEEAAAFQKELNDINVKFANEQAKIDKARREAITAATLAVRAKVSKGAGK